MMQDTSIMRVTVRRNPLGTPEARDYEWQGKSPYIRISYGVVRELGYRSFPAHLQCGPYLLLIVESEPWMDCGLYVRSDRLGWLRVGAYRATRLLDLIYRRSIITLAVWKLAEFHEAYMPSWRDVYVLRKIFK